MENLYGFLGIDICFNFTVQVSLKCGDDTSKSSSGESSFSILFKNCFQVALQEYMH